LLGGGHGRPLFCGNPCSAELAIAQSPPAGTTTHIRGTVDKLDGQNLMVRSRDGQTLTIELAANVAVITLVKKSIADIIG
jgi:hypothetical protein